MSRQPLFILSLGALLLQSAQAQEPVPTAAPPAQAQSTQAQEPDPPPAEPPAQAAQAQEPDPQSAAPPAQAQTTQAQDVDQARDREQARALAHTAQDPQLKWLPCPEFMPEGCAIAVLHGDPSQDNADVFLRVPAGAEIPLHWHTSAERMVLVEGDLRVTYAGQDPVALSTGTYAYVPAKMPHEGRCGSAGACTLFIAFEQPLDAFPGSPPQ